MSKKICFVVTVAFAAKNFLCWSFEEYHKNGFDITLVCDMDKEFESSLPDYVHAVPLKMARGIDPKGLFEAINFMTKLFKENKFDIVQYSTPNASLYASVAAKRAKIPVRLYCQWGLVYLGFSGIKRQIFKSIEKYICKKSTYIQPDSHGNLEFCRDNNFYNAEKSCVIWNGCANGLNLSKFDIGNKEKYRAEILNEYNLTDDNIILGFLGRVGKDKGFNELVSAFKAVKEKYPTVKLLYVGYNEKPETVDQDLLNYFSNCSDIISTNGWVDDPQRYLAAMDIFVFPSYREGFGNVVIEAEAMGTPVITTNIPGPKNGIVNGLTGILVEPKTVEPLVEQICYLIENKEIREQMGKSGRDFVVKSFDNKILIKKIIENRNLLIDNINK